MVAARRWMTLPQAPPQQSVDAEQQAGAGGYADSASCAMCHDAIARTYSLTGMARSFAKLRPDTTPPADFSVRNRLYHDASDRHYTMVERDGTFYQRRHQIGFDGREANSVEFAADYVIGSGNHARTFLHRSADGQLLQLPVSWYAERGGYWAMSPGYDGPAHLDFRRVIDAGCMSCHNGYPRAPVPDADSAPKFGDSLPEGIDCQRCHGPGQAHVEAVKTGALDAARLAIVNPARFDRDRQLETCMQCHLEPTSTPLPFQVRRYEQPPFSFSPGKALGDYFIYFDHAPGSGRDDKFEIAGGAYRLSKSACFQRSQMTCQTCHDPHDIPRGEAAVKRYVAVCQGCHEGTHRSGVPRVQGVGATPTCLDCHMPKRRTEDAVHVVMTDHFIQRRRAAGNLLAAIQETDALRQGDYRGEVALYYPKTLPPTPENELYLALAQVQQGSNLTAGIQRLEQAIEKHRPARPDFYYELARAYSQDGEPSSRHPLVGRGAATRRHVRAGAQGAGRRPPPRSGTWPGPRRRWKKLSQFVPKTRRRWPISATYTCANKSRRRAEVARTCACARSGSAAGEQHDGAGVAAEGPRRCRRTASARGDPHAARSRRGAQQPWQSAGGPQGVRRGRASLRAGHPQRSELCGGAPQLWRGPGADALVSKSGDGAAESGQAGAWAGSGARRSRRRAGAPWAAPRKRRGNTRSPRRATMQRRGRPRSRPCARWAGRASRARDSNSWSTRDSNPLTKPISVIDYRLLKPPIVGFSTAFTTRRLHVAPPFGVDSGGPALSSALLVAVPAMSQSFYGSLVSVVNDDQGGVIPGATVILVNTVHQRTTRRRERGRWRRTAS